jgi:hypothetical protein
MQGRLRIAWRRSVQMNQIGQRLGLHALLLASLIIASLTMTTVTAAEGPPQQVIIKWRDAATPAEQTARTTHSLREAGARQGVAFQFLRKMGTGASVYKLNPVLPARELDALIKALNGDPHVEYAEADGMMRTMPRVIEPAPRPAEK